MKAYFMYVYSFWGGKAHCSWDSCPSSSCMYSWWLKSKFGFICFVVSSLVLHLDYNHHFKLITGWGRSIQPWRAASKWRPGFMWLRLPVTVCKPTQASLNWGKYHVSKNRKYTFCFCVCNVGMKQIVNVLCQKSCWLSISQCTKYNM